MKTQHCSVSYNMTPVDGDIYLCVFDAPTSTLLSEAVCWSSDHQLTFYTEEIRISFQSDDVGETGSTITSTVTTTAGGNNRSRWCR